MTHWLDDTVPRNNRPLSDVPGFMLSATPESEAHRRSLDIVEIQPFWPANTPGHLHNLVWYRYTGPLRTVMKAMQEVTPGVRDIPVETYAEAFLMKAGTTDAMRNGLIDVCSDGDINSIIASLTNSLMAETFKEEVRHLGEVGAYVFTSQVPQHFINPFDFNIGGDA